MENALPEGKISHELLEELLASLPTPGQEVVVRPGIGKDAAGLELQDRCVAVATDPITFATDRLATYSVCVNVNDVACLGCRPRWFTADVLLPVGTTESQLREFWKELVQQLERFSMDGIGGHTEVTHAVEHPVVCGQIMGPLITDSFLTPDRARPGDRLLLWQGIAVEGTALSARECGDAIGAGLDETRRNAMRDLLDDPGICVWPAVEKLLPEEGVVCLHDPTEGGVATALHELADAAGCGVEVHRERISIRPETEWLREVFDFDPLGLLASGSLLIVVRPGAESRVLEKMSGEPITPIGQLTEDSTRVLRDGEEWSSLPRYSSDQILTILEQGTS